MYVYIINVSKKKIGRKIKKPIKFILLFYPRKKETKKKKNRKEINKTEKETKIKINNIR